MSNSSENNILAKKTGINKEKNMGLKGPLTYQSHRGAPFETACIEHTLLDVMLVDSKNRTILGRPWVTLLIDEFTRKVLGYHLSFNPSSYVSNMMVIRECVKRYSKLPNTLVIDEGKEFFYHDFHAFMAKYSIVIKTSPLKKRFKVDQNRFLEIISGIRRLAITNVTSFTIEELKGLLHRVFEESANQFDHSSQYMSTRARVIEYDENFEVITCPSPVKKTRTIIHNKGVKINNNYYWSKEFENMGSKQVPVKYDPEDTSTAYAYLNDNWIKLFAI